MLDIEPGMVFMQNGWITVDNIEEENSAVIIDCKRKHLLITFGRNHLLSLGNDCWMNVEHWVKAQWQSIGLAGRRSQLTFLPISDWVRKYPWNWCSREQLCISEGNTELFRLMVWISCQHPKFLCRSVALIAFKIYSSPNPAGHWCRLTLSCAFHMFIHSWLWSA